jgi:hypothetical protein
MNTQPPDLNKREIDSAALAASALAAVLAVSLSKGPFDALNFIVGVTLTILILAYEHKGSRDPLQSVALGAVLGLCSLLVLGFVIERWVFCTSLDAAESNVSHTWLVCLWLGVTILFSGIDMAWLQRSRR